MWNDEAWRLHLTVSGRSYRYGSQGMNPWYWYELRQPITSDGKRWVVWLNDQSGDWFLVKLRDRTIDTIRFTNRVLVFPVRRDTDVETD